jgi:hypothetical protein
MKTNPAFLACILMFAAVPGLRSGEPEPAQSVSPEFERMKSLVGKWEGKADMGQGPVEMDLQFRLIAGGSVLEERVFAGTPHEMVSMYYVEDGKLAMTHYCVLGNRPMMRLKSATGDTIEFDFDARCGIDPEKETHMHALTLKFVDPDTIESSCRAFADGKEAPAHAVTLKRVK